MVGFLDTHVISNLSKKHINKYVTSNEAETEINSLPT